MIIKVECFQNNVFYPLKKKRHTKLWQKHTQAERWLIYLTKVSIYPLTRKCTNIEHILCGGLNFYVWSHEITNQ